MLQGMLEFLTSEEAADLRRNFVFRIIPMLNIDGVVFGNQRCSLLGVDLNRRWVSPNVFLHPTIFYAKHLVRHMHNERRVLMYCDLHGHSRKQNAFFYACTYKNYEHEGRIKNAQIRMMPLLCCHKAPDHFKFADCRFRIEKCKESTARVVIFREFNIMNAFTLETSFFGKEPEQPPEPQPPEENPDEEEDERKVVARKKY
jgi:cytosolic carboxypeptidase protein 2/3